MKKNRSAGASHVYTIEANPDFAKLATEIIELNQLKKKVTLLNTLSTKVEVKEGLSVGGQSSSHHPHPHPILIILTSSSPNPHPIIT